MPSNDALIAVAAVESIISQAKKLHIDPCVVIGLRIARDRLQSIPEPQPAPPGNGITAEDLDDEITEDDAAPMPLPLPPQPRPMPPIQF